MGEVVEDIARICFLMLNVRSRNGQRGEWNYSSTISLVSALGVGVFLTPRPGRFNRYKFCKRLGGPQGRSGRVCKASPPPGFDPWTVHPVA
jgi:hypothetical protein